MKCMHENNTLASSLSRNNFISINIQKNINIKFWKIQYQFRLTWTKQHAHLHAGEESFHLPLKREHHLKKIHLTETRLEQF